MSFLSKVILFGTILNFLFYENPHIYIYCMDVMWSFPVLTLYSHSELFLDFFSWRVLFTWMWDLWCDCNEFVEPSTSLPPAFQAPFLRAATSLQVLLLRAELLTAPGVSQQPQSFLSGQWRKDCVGGMSSHLKIKHNRTNSILWGQV